ncbi:hypothetical protein ['Camptotheca acuminata' phytoplasma]|uniref:hypothetical protein n=1 Tax='Camptotheca acuminata' phytoplasma TaxID=3239192 RepID=UPI003519EC49
MILLPLLITILYKTIKSFLSNINPIFILLPLTLIFLLTPFIVVPLLIKHIVKKRIVKDVYQKYYIYL